MRDWGRLLSSEAGRDALALLLFAARYRSRHVAKRKLRDLGLGEGRAAELDELIAFAAGLAADLRDDLERRVQALAVAHAQTEAATLRRRGPDEPRWIVGQDAASGADWVVYIGPDAAWAGRMFADREAAARAGAIGELIALDLGEVIGDVLWLDAPPNHHERARLYERTRAALRGYDALIDADELREWALWS